MHAAHTVLFTPALATPDRENRDQFGHAHFGGLASATLGSLFGGRAMGGFARC